MTHQTDPYIVRLLAESARQVPEEERDLMQTLLALGVPIDRASSLIVDENSRHIAGFLVEYAHHIRDHRAGALPEGSEARRRLNMIADWLDPTTEDSWDFEIREEGSDGMV